MRVIVTGGSGLTGRHVVAELVAHGYEVLNVDRVPPNQPLAPYKLVEMEELGQVYGSLSGADAIVHLAAIPRPTFHTNEVVFRTNVISTYHVFEAAAQLGIARVVWASSMSVLGFPFYYRPFAPRYVPVDEAHPRLPQDVYALSKVLGEEMAEAFVRRSSMTVVSLRLAWVHTPESFREQLVPLWEDHAAGASNLWAWLDARDAARAARLALEAELSGHEPFFIAARTSFMREPSADLVRRVYPESTIRPGLQGNGSLISTEKAERLLGYRPVHPWELFLDSGTEES
ncbi:MAG: NAD(P)-dependent oxidoreductase [Chloroflexota bacterium]|nr:NAD(P)-dependent oxidoreductase [Chloroflexota bacterium]